MGWVQFIALIMGSSVVGSLVSQGTNWVKEHRNSKRDRLLSALYLAVQLEEYADVCARVVSDNETWRRNHRDDVPDNDENLRRPSTNVAPLPEFRPDIDWKALGVKTANDLMSFRIRLENCASAIQVTGEFDDDDAAMDLTTKWSIKLGIQAWELGRQLRGSDRQLERPNDLDDWSIEEYLRGRAAVHEPA